MRGTFAHVTGCENVRPNFALFENNCEVQVRVAQKTDMFDRNVTFGKSGSLRGIIGVSALDGDGRSAEDSFWLEHFAEDSRKLDRFFPQFTFV